MAATVLLAGCGGDSGPPLTAGPAASSTSAPESRPEEPRAEAAVLQRSDLPTDWKVQPEGERPDHEATWAMLVKCLDVEPPPEIEGSAAVSPTFVLGLGTQVTSTVEYLRTIEDGRRLSAALAGDRAALCMKDALVDDVRRNAPDGMTLGPISVAPLVISGAGPVTVAFRATGTITPMPNFEIPVSTDLVVTIDEQAVSRLSFIGGGEPFPPDLQRELTEKVAART
ncbi:MAG: hypothetical protein ACT4OS_00635 [Acidimicrobiales bacterium]